MSVSKTNFTYWFKYPQVQGVFRQPADALNDNEWGQNGGRSKLIALPLVIAQEFIELPGVITE